MINISDAASEKLLSQSSIFSASKLHNSLNSAILELRLIRGLINDKAFNFKVILWFLVLESKNLGAALNDRYALRSSAPKAVSKNCLN